MIWFPATHWTGLALRLVMVAVCLLPFPGVRAVAGVLAVPASAPLPTAPVNEEDESEREESEARAADPRAERPFHKSHPFCYLIPVERSAARPDRSALSRPTAADPFRNGLGSHYRC